MPGAILIEPTVVRELHDDEKLVLEDFENHAARCTRCNLSNQAYEASYCDRGHNMALDVTRYLYVNNGKHYAVVDKEIGKPMRVKLPRSTTATRRLLESMEEGMRLSSPRRGRASPVRAISSSSSRPVIEQSRRRSYTPEASSPPLQIIERSPSTSKRHVIVYPRSSGSSTSSRSPSSRSCRSSHSSCSNRSNRGSLYLDDHLDREERRYDARGHRYYR